MSREAVRQEENGGERAKVIAFLFVSAVFLFAEIGFMDLSLLKAPELTGWIYEKVTLPESLLFVTHLKGVFGVVMMAVSCLPAFVLMGITGAVMSKIAGK